MGYTTEIWTDYAIGAGIGLAIYHFVLRKKYPTTFPALNNVGINNVGINSVDQISGIDLDALNICRQNGLI